MTDSEIEPKKVEEPVKESMKEVSGDTPKEDDGLDDLGYEKPKQEMKDGKESKESSEKSSQKDDEKELLDQKIEPASGYEKEPPKDAGSKEPEKKEESAAAPTKDDEFAVKDPGDLLPEEINIIKDFVKKFKVSKEVGQGLVEIKKQEVAKLQAAMKEHEQKKIQETLKVKRGWYEELKADATFGGEKFDFNVKRVDKVIQDFMPNLKKMLTESKGMLPPYVMKDLAKLSNHLYSSENLVEGNPSKMEKESKAKEDDPLAFYNS